MYSIETSLAVFLTNLSIICFAKSSVMDFLLSDDCAISDIKAPSNSRILLEIL